MPPLIRIVPLSAFGAGAARAAATAGSPARSATVKVAFLQGEQVVHVTRNGSTLRQAVIALLAGPTSAEQKREIASAVPARTPLRAVSVANGIATIDLGEKFAAGTNTASLSARVTQLVLTATSVSGVKSVRLLVKGATPLGLFPGYVTSRPISAKFARAPDLPPPGEPAPEPTTNPTAAVRDLQQRLADLSYLPPEAVDGEAGEQTRFAVMAFQKWQGLSRDGTAGPATMAALASATRPTPRTIGAGNRFEVLLDRQLVLYIENGAVVRTLHVSSGAPGYETPTGRFSVFRKEANSWSVPYKVWLPWASYFVGGVAFHESPDVPAQPASHGCVRVPRYDAKWLYDHAPVGTAVTVLGSSR
jgi:lipoprotein-anchoring transpeptidase ErfK/SrfK